MSIVWYFPWTQSNLNLEIKRRFNFNDSLWQAICEIFQKRAKYSRLEQIPPPFPYLKHLQVINPSFVTITKLSSNEIRETICEGLQWMCKPFEIKAQQDFKKLIIFSISSKHFIVEVAQGNSHQFYLASFSDSGILCFFTLSYNGNNLSVKLLKSLFQVEK